MVTFWYCLNLSVKRVVSNKSVVSSLKTIAFASPSLRADAMAEEMFYTIVIITLYRITKYNAAHTMVTTASIQYMERYERQCETMK